MKIDNHMTLAAVLQAIIDISLILKRVDEPGNDDYPIMLSVVAQRCCSASMCT